VRAGTGTGSGVTACDDAVWAELVGHVRLSVGGFAARAGSVFAGFAGAGMAVAGFAAFVAGLTTASVSCTDRSAVATGASIGAGVVATTVFAEPAPGVALGRSAK
jgi:hypothetical protein